MLKEHAQIALQDIKNGLKNYPLAAYLAWHDVGQRYKRTLLGPFWIVLSTGIWFSMMGFVMANLFGREPSEYLPFMVSGLLVWLLFASSVNESSQVLTQAAAIITSFPVPIFTHYLRFVLRNYIIFLHNLLLLIIILMIYPPDVNVNTWMVIPGILLNMIILMGISVILSLANLRYRDTHLAVASAVQILPFITPIFWDRGMLKNHHWIADINPLYHMIEVVRSPLLGKEAALNSWMIASALAVCLFAGACMMFIRYRHRIIFWL
jgi:ABC-type polysaccharide/polyol phosphate export permease